MIAFAIFAVYAGTLYQQLQEVSRISTMFNTVAAITAAVAGWMVVGPQIDRRILHSVFGVVQGMVVAILLAVAASATVETFRLGYKTRYKDLYDAGQGFFAHIATFAQKLAVPEMMVPMATFCLGAGLGLSLLYRMLEARRLAG
jgi:hypothetical protein